MVIQFVENQFVDSYDPTIENSKFFLAAVISPGNESISTFSI